MNSLLPYYGGKSGRIGQWIAQQLPRHRCYVEPFGGMAGVLMYKKPSDTEVYNDLEALLVNLFRVVRTPELCRQLQRALHFTPYSRLQHRTDAAGLREESIDDVERARRTYTTLAQDFKGSLGYTSFGFGGPKARGNEARAFVNAQQRISVVAERFRLVQLENKPALEVCQSWDHAHTCLYLDPPYTADERNGAWVYSQETSHGLHQDLVSFALAAESKIILSGYRNPLYEAQLEANGWLRRDFATTTRVGNSRVGEKARRVESIWLNPRAAMATPTLFCGHATTSN